MYPYHNRLKQLLKTENYYVIEEKLPYAFRFMFSGCGKSYPIRPERIGEYLEWLD